MDFLQNHIEALIFCSPVPLKLSELCACLTDMFGTEIPEQDVIDAIKRLEERYSSDEYSFQIFKAAGGYQFLTKPAYQSSVGILLKNQAKKKLSTSSLETLSIIAYKQPVSKPEIDNIRGVNCEFTIQKLLEKGLVEIRGKSDGVGRPLLYGTTEKFMEYMGISDLSELPQPKDFASEENTIGESLDLKDPDAPQA